MAHKETHRPSIFWPMAWVCFGLVGGSVKFRVAHPERIPVNGAYIVAPNHYSEIDPVIIGMLLFRAGRNPRFLTKASLFKIPVVGWFLRRSGQVPVERSSAAGSGARSPFAAARELVEKQRIVVVYPEGTLTREPDMWPMRGKFGAARIALEQGIPVIPVAHWGTQALMGRYAKKISLFRKHPIDFSVGEPVDLSEFEGKPLDKRLLADATEKIMVGITRELERLRGEKAPAVRWDPTMHGQSETGRIES